MKLTYGALIALIVASVAPGCGPSNGSDSGITPDTDAGMIMPPDAHIPPDVDAGPDRPDTGGSDVDSGGPGLICAPSMDPMCTMGSYTGCRCDPAPYARMCEIEPTACSATGVNTCGPMANHCGYNMPMDMSSVEPFTNAACMTNLYGVWAVSGTETTFRIIPAEAYNGQMTLDVGDPGTLRLMSDFYSGITLSGDRGWYNWTNLNHPTRGLHCWLTWGPTCTGGEVQCWNSGVDPRVTPGAPMAPGFPLYTERLRPL